MAEEPAVDEALDLTNEHLRTLEGVEIKPGLTVRRAGRELVVVVDAADVAVAAIGRATERPPSPSPLARARCRFVSLSRNTFPSNVYTKPQQTVDLTTNRLREIDPRVLALTGGF